MGRRPRFSLNRPVWTAVSRSWPFANGSRCPWHAKSCLWTAGPPGRCWSSPPPVPAAPGFRNCWQGFCTAAFIPEHLRPQQFRYLRSQDDASMQVLRWMQEIATRLRCGRNAGSKFIWDSVPDVPALQDIDQCRALLEPLWALRPVCLRLRRKNILAQAISRYRAVSTGIYHHVEPRRRWTLLPVAAETIRPRAQVAYDADAIRHHREVLLRAERHLDAFLGAVPLSVREIVYEDLVADVQTALNPALSELLDAQGPGESIPRLERALRRSVIRKSSDPSGDAWCKRFLSETKQ